jgi:hypothetical protein
MFLLQAFQLLLLRISYYSRDSTYDQLMRERDLAQPTDLVER